MIEIDILNKLNAPTREERLEAARQAAYLWNIGKVLTDTPND